MYYEENMTQAQIAKKLDVSRPLISNILSKARDLGIVQIQIKEPFGNNNSLMRQIKELFNLEGGIVVPSSNSSYMTEELVLNHTVNYMIELLPETQYMGLGWGYLIGKIVDKLSNLDVDINENLSGDICQLIGSAAIPNKGYRPGELITDFAKKTGFKPHYFFSPAFPSTKQEKDLYTNTDNYKQISELWCKLDLALFSIGTYPSVPDHATALRFGDKLVKNNAVGKILSYFYDEQGHFIKSEDDFAIQIPLEKIKNIKNVVTVCPVESNVNSIIGALRTGFITHLILSEYTATDIINHNTL